MNRLNYIMPILVLGHGVYLKTQGDHWYSMGMVVVSVFMWLLVLGGEMKSKNQGYGTDK